MQGAATPHIRGCIIVNSTYKTVILVVAPTFEVGAPPTTDEAAAQVENNLVAHILRNAARLDMICEVERGAEQQQRHIVVRCDRIVVLVHYDFSHWVCLGMRPRCGQHVYSHHHSEVVPEPSKQKSKLVLPIADVDTVSKQTRFKS